MTKHHRGHRDEKFRFVFMTGDPGPGGHEGQGEFGPRGFAPGGHGEHGHGPRGRGRGNRRYGRGHDGGFPGFLGRGPRAGRGDVRAAILTLLTEQPMHGYQIMREIGERSGGVWRPSPGSIYPTLQQLEDEELVRAETGDGGRRVYALTDAGREAQTASAGGKAPWDEVGVEGDTSALELRDLVGQVMAAARQVLHAGEAAQIAQAKDVLRDTRRKLYRILAEDSPEAPEAAPSEPDAT
jgi:DNA-binding PadR family transcriptional regulator